MRFVFFLFQKINREEKSKGRRHELKAVAAFKGQFYDVPEWFISIENASERQDRAGIDVIIKSDVGKLFVQIKSCESKARKFREDQERGKYRRDIAVVVIKEHFSPTKVRRVIITGAQSEYQRILSETAIRQSVISTSAEAA